jgi:hypothetical protein
MVATRAALVMLVVLALTACKPITPPPPTATPASPIETPTEIAAGTPVPPVTGAFIPFDEFLQGVRDATFEEYAAREGAQVLNSEEFEAMREHILTLYEGVEVVSTFVIDEQYFDCVTIDSQPSVRLLDLGRADLESPQSSVGTDEGVGGEAPGAGEGLESPLRLGLIDVFGNQIACDEGTIPLRRITLEEMTRFETLDAFFGKGPDGMGEEPPDPEQEVPPEEGAVEHKYAAGRQRVTNFGGNSWLNLWNPAIGTDHIFSLSQQWYAAGDGDSKQTLEGGWQVYPQKYSTNNGVLFIYYTADNYGSKGCYNLDCAGFVQINNNWYIGGTWTQYSSTGDTQWGFEMQWKLFRENWWLFIKGPGDYEAVGYYPASVYEGGLMSRSADRITYGGETTGKGRFPPMGSGEFSNQGWQRAAFHNTIFYIPRNEDNGVGVWADLFEIEPSPDCYTIDITPASDGGNWGTYFFYGGPGGDPC